MSSLANTALLVLLIAVLLAASAAIIKSLAALMPNVLTAYVDGEASEIKSLNKS